MCGYRSKRSLQLCGVEICLLLCHLHQVESVHDTDSDNKKLQSTSRAVTESLYHAYYGITVLITNVQLGNNLLLVTCCQVRVNI